jgi:hypothetical protein
VTLLIIIIGFVISSTAEKKINALTKVQGENKLKLPCLLFSGLYRRSWNCTRSACMARGLKAKPLTTGRELALAAAPCPEGIIFNY